MHGIRLCHFHDSTYPQRRDSLSASELYAWIEHHEVLCAREWLARAMNGSLDPRDCCLTFDGNLSCQRDIALPVLKRFGMTAFWFVCTAPLMGDIVSDEIDALFRDTCFRSQNEFHREFFDSLERSEHWPLVEMLVEERPLDWSRGAGQFEFIRDRILGPARFRDVIDSMQTNAGFDANAAARGLWMCDQDLLSLHAQGHVIGLHSHTGPTNLADLDEDAQRDEYFENYHYIHNLLDERPIAMSHPGGSYNETTLTILRELEIQFGFCQNECAGSTNLEIPRQELAGRALPARLAA